MRADDWIPALLQGRDLRLQSRSELQVENVGAIALRRLNCARGGDPASRQQTTQPVFRKYDP